MARADVLRHLAIRMVASALLLDAYLFAQLDLGQPLVSDCVQERPLPPLTQLGHDVEVTYESVRHHFRTEIGVGDHEASDSKAAECRAFFGDVADPVVLHERNP